MTDPLYALPVPLPPRLRGERLEGYRKRVVPGYREKRTLSKDRQEWAVKTIKRLAREMGCTLSPKQLEGLRPLAAHAWSRDFPELHARLVFLAQNVAPDVYPPE